MCGSSATTVYISSRATDTQARCPAFAILRYGSYVKGFKIAPTHFINQGLARIWLDK